MELLVEQKKRQTAEAELQIIRRRGQAPYLIPSRDRFNMMYVPSENPAAIEFRSPRHSDILCEDRHEVDRQLAAGSRIFFVVDNTGHAARRIKIDLDGTPALIGTEPEMSDSKGRQFLIYSYDPSRHGQEQRLRISFETSDGIQDTHIYSLRHGLRSLYRIDPA